jgi:hypothetical protein
VCELPYGHDELAERPIQSRLSRRNDELRIVPRQSQTSESLRGRVRLVPLGYDELEECQIQPRGGGRNDEL